MAQHRQREAGEHPALEDALPNVHLLIKKEPHDKLSVRVKFESIGVTRMSGSWLQWGGVPRWTRRR